MIRWKVLRFMGVLTVMKFGLFIVSAVSLTLALGWILIYCPSSIKSKASSDTFGASVSSRQSMGVADYFKSFESKLDEELGELKRKEPEKLKEMSKPVRKFEFTLPIEQYTDEHFANMIRQLDHQELDGYEFFIESMNVTFYRKPKGNSGLYEYKLYVNMPEAEPDMLTDVFLDSDYRLEWDSYITELFYVKRSEHGPDVVYFNVDFPWPLANRDYVYAREMRKISQNGKEYFVIIMHSVLSHNIPPKNGVVRVDDFHQRLAVESVSTGGSKAFIHYYDDPKGNLPSWLINWAAKTGVPGFIKDIQRACRGYEPFKKKHGRP